MALILKFSSAQPGTFRPQKENNISSQKDQTSKEIGKQGVYSTVVDYESEFIYDLHHNILQKLAISYKARIERYMQI